MQVNASGKEHSIPLLMAASDLLFQITAFLKDSHHDLLRAKESFIGTDQGRYSWLTFLNFDLNQRLKLYQKMCLYFAINLS